MKLKIINNEPCLVFFDSVPYGKRRLELRFNNFIKNYPEYRRNVIPEDLLGLIESYIDVKGNAWCMDVRLERKKWQS